MYGLISQMIAAPGMRGELASILKGAVGEMPGCLSCVIAEDKRTRTRSGSRKCGAIGTAIALRSGCRRCRPQSSGRGP